jgi:hypothetical protein
MAIILDETSRNGFPLWKVIAAAWTSHEASISNLLARSRSRFEKRASLTSHFGTALKFSK